MAHPIEHFENIEDPYERSEQLHREIERLQKVHKHLTQGTACLDDVSNPGGVGKALEDGLEHIREQVGEAFTVADRAAHDLQQRIDELQKMHDKALDEHYEEA